MNNTIRTLVVALALFVLAVSLYWPVRGYGFVNLDDPDNVSRHPLVYEGLTPGGIRVALTTSDPDYWRPLTWLSFMIDTEVYGARAQPTTHPEIPREIPDSDASGYHLTNVLLHALATVMLLLALHALTGCFWRSAIVAAIFAVHPLRVESVAWITERKDVLSGVFAFAALWAYAKYGRRATMMPRPPLHWIWMIVTTMFLGLGLMSKSTLVTLPFVFLLLDFWPLRRIDPFDRPKPLVRTALWLLIEKVPLFIVTAASCWMTLHGGQRSVADLSLRLRLANAIVSYVRYIGKMFWPVDLAVYYPYPGIGGLEPWSKSQVLGSLAILALITLMTITFMRRRPYLIVGWCWFVGMLVPVIGLLQVGNQGMADRFTYLPGIGLMIMVIWLIVDVFGRSWAGRAALAVVSLAVIVGSALATRHLLPTWAGTDALYQRALAVTEMNRAVHMYYGDYLHHQKRHEESLRQFQHAADLTPEDAMPRFKLGMIYADLKKNYESQQEFERAVLLDPNHADAQFNLAMMLVRRGQPDAARPHFERALELNPAGAAKYNQLRNNMRSGGAGTADKPDSDGHR